MISENKILKSQVPGFDFFDPKIQSVRLHNFEYRYQSGYELALPKSGVVSQIEIILNADGSFLFCDDNCNSANTGTWKFKAHDTEDARLLLKFASGNEIVFRVGYGKGSGIMLDGKRFTIEAVCK